MYACRCEGLTCLTCCVFLLSGWVIIQAGPLHSGWAPARCLKHDCMESLGSMRALSDMGGGGSTQVNCTQPCAQRTLQQPHCGWMGLVQAGAPPSRKQCLQVSLRLQWQHRSLPCGKPPNQVVFQTVSDQTPTQPQTHVSLSRLTIQ
jgi:hypothetical protein